MDEISSSEESMVLLFFGLLGALATRDSDPIAMISESGKNDSCPPEWTGKSLIKLSGKLETPDLSGEPEDDYGTVVGIEFGRKLNPCTACRGGWTVSAVVLAIVAGFTMSRSIFTG
ncbi:hypothetical protein M422DRAFT_254880 [Sphaerobolus stellatus SS14]|uniref:Uncharacterized protein n=1 Tax=Sphaerobolus stellatus (strain SS14) TaxID=990650 RepID=A0A0C9V5I5_SPHS4|nr:hypothetical protein M422DRAFT_254880 [Sphaerobolus stellatus SS14]